MRALSSSTLQARADVFKALGHPTRLAIVDMLAEGERCVCELNDHIDADISTVSRHLAVLRNVGILSSEKRGNQVFYRLDRMITHLLLAGILDRVSGIVMGKFTKIPEEGNSFNLEEIIEQLLVPLGIPVVRGLMIGHVTDKTTAPIGIEAELDGDAGTLTLLEPAVT